MPITLSVPLVSWLQSEVASGRYASVDAAVEAMVDGLQQGGLPGGLIVCAMRQLPVAQTLRAKWAASHEMLRAAVERGQKDGSVRNAAPSAALADLLLALMAGLRVNARADFGAARQRRAVDLALSVLDSG